MGIISDAIDSLETWCENLFKDGIKSQFDNISGLLTDTFNTATGDGGLVQTFLIGHPVLLLGILTEQVQRYGRRSKHYAILWSYRLAALS